MNLLPSEAAERLRVSPGTLANWRSARNGPSFIKFGRKVLYPEAELNAFEQANLHNNTAAMRITNEIQERAGGR
jgi:hypothetical protein